MEEDPLHPIIDRPHEYAIEDLHFHVGPDFSERYVDLVLRKEATVRRLRFWSPTQFQIEEGCFPNPTGGMVIYDVRGRRLDGIGVWVSDFESTRGSITFWAREVVDLDELEAGA